MTYENMKYVADYIDKALMSLVGEDYKETIAYCILQDVINDIEVSADIDFNDSDIRFAIGRVLLNKMGLNET